MWAYGIIEESVEIEHMKLYLHLLNTNPWLDYTEEEKEVFMKEAESWVEEKLKQLEEIK